MEPTSRLAVAAGLPMGRRLGWDDYFLMLAEAAATRSTCIRRRVGCVLVQDRTIVATGFNGGLPGTRHCAAGGCPRANAEVPPGVANDNDPATACIALHAEQNAVVRLRHRPVGPMAAYVTHSPCYPCAKLLAASGITEVIAAAAYPGFDLVRDFLLDNEVRVRLLREVDVQSV